MFELLPVELIEHILLFLSATDIVYFFTAFNEQCNLFPDYFWKRLCLRKDINPSCERLEHYKCFQSLKNKTLGLYKSVENVPPGILKYIYFDFFVIRVGNLSSLNTFTFNVYLLECNNTFKLVQEITAFHLTFIDEFIIDYKSESETDIYTFNTISNEVSFKQCFFQSKPYFHGMSETYCLFSTEEENCIYLYSFLDGTKQEIQLTPDTNIFDMVKYCRRTNTVFVSIVTFTHEFRIKVFNITSQTWVLNLMVYSGCRDAGNAFSRTLTTYPKIWADQNFIGSYVISYPDSFLFDSECHFGPFKVWNKTGELILQTEIKPTSSHRIKCFFNNDHIILTTSDKTISSFNKNGELVSVLETSTYIVDVKLSGSLLFILLQNNTSVEIYDWRKCSLLYTIPQDARSFSSICTENLYCAFKNTKQNTYDIVSFV